MRLVEMVEVCSALSASVPPDTSRMDIGVVIFISMFKSSIHLMVAVKERIQSGFLELDEKLR